MTKPKAYSLSEDRRDFTNQVRVVIQQEKKVLIQKVSIERKINPRAWT